MNILLREYIQIILKESPLYVKSSPIHGSGVFSKEILKKGFRSTEDRDIGQWSDTINHSDDPNVLILPDGSFEVIKDIQPEEELVTDYRKMQGMFPGVDLHWKV